MKSLFPKKFPLTEHQKVVLATAKYQLTQPDFKLLFDGRQQGIKTPVITSNHHLCNAMISGCNKLIRVNGGAFQQKRLGELMAKYKALEYHFMTAFDNTPADQRKYVQVGVGVEGSKETKEHYSWSDFCSGVVFNAVMDLLLNEVPIGATCDAPELLQATKERHVGINFDVTKADIDALNDSGITTRVQ